MQFFSSFKPFDVEGLKLAFGAELEKFRDLDPTNRENTLINLQKQPENLTKKSRVLYTQALKVIALGAVSSLTILATGVLLKVSSVLTAPLAAIALSVGFLAGRLLFKNADSFAEGARLRSQFYNHCNEIHKQSPLPLISLEISENTLTYTVEPNQGFYFVFDDMQKIEYWFKNQEPSHTIEKNESTGKYMFPQLLQAGACVLFRIQKTDGTWLTHKPFVISVA